MPEQNIAPPKIKPNYLYSIFSVAFVLLVVGVFGLMLLQIQQLIQWYKESINILVELNDEVTTNQVDSLQEALTTKAFLKPGTLRYINKEQAAQLMEGDFGDDAERLGLANPYANIIEFNVKAAYIQSDSLQEIRQQLQGMSMIDTVLYPETSTESLTRNLTNVGYITVALSIFFFVVAITIIHNTIRLSLYANRFLIKNMQLVGASWRFISRPYLLRGLAHGFISSVLAIAVLSGFLFWVRINLPQFQLLENTMVFVWLLLVLIPIGMGIYGLSTYRVVNKYLKMRIDDLY